MFLALENFNYLVDIYSTTEVLKIYNIHYKHINSDEIQYITKNNAIYLQVN